MVEVGSLCTAQIRGFRSTATGDLINVKMLEITVLSRCFCAYWMIFKIYQRATLGLLNVSVVKLTLTHTHSIQVCFKTWQASV